jgi:hypothetical protein
MANNEKFFNGNQTGSEMGGAARSDFIYLSIAAGFGRLQTLLHYIHHNLFLQEISYFSTMKNARSQKMQEIG